MPPRRTPVLRQCRPGAAQHASLGITTTPEDGRIAGDRPQHSHFLYELPQHLACDTANLKSTLFPYDKCDACGTFLFPIAFRIAGRPSIRENQAVVSVVGTITSRCASYGYG
jgi:hypothetical protein